MERARCRVIVRGQVQGVGFRPFVFNLAEEAGLTGFVRNSPRGVVIEIQGPAGDVADFARHLQERLPPLARITRLAAEAVPLLEGETEFSISPSTAGETHAVLISPDTCTCADCLADMADPGNRRFGYPFTNCTNCGPRYTITRSIPYDRATTSMACFPLCPDCRAEYENPRDRRFHAQPNACPVCGPRVWLVRPGERPPESGDLAEPSPGALPVAAGGAAQGDAALAELAALLLDGGIAAVKGLGGFHLACDARNDAAVERLRLRKHRPHKPFAVMAAGLEDVRRFAEVSPQAEALLLSPERPIVLCPLLPGHGLSPLLSPDTCLAGVMLPYTPLHFRLFEHAARLSAEREAAATAGGGRPPVLVMTSGNPGGEPICLGNREALAHLGSMAEAFLFHNRDILIRVDDSVLRPLPDGGTLHYRRARGFVPRPVALALPSAHGCADAPVTRNPDEDAEAARPKPRRTDAPATDCVLAVGAELKNTLCLTKDGDAFVSQHIGDMANVETAAFHGEMREHLADLLRVSPALVVRDLHPDYLSSRMAEELAAERGLELRALQHHAAHAFAVLAEHAFRGRALVLALDGTGLGEDGALWGGECLLAETGANGSGPRWRRLAHLAPMDLPGGEAAIREPWRIAHALLLRLGLLEGGLPPWLPEYAPAAAVLPAMVERRVNCPVSTSCGRLFDATAALLGLCPATTYEGQAAIRLEEAQGRKAWEREPARLLACPISDGKGGLRLLNTHALFAALEAERRRGAPTAELALSFHHSLARGLAALAVELAARHGVGHVGLSGGCLQNVTLATLLGRRLRRAGLTVLEHRQLPPGDGCISLGQAFWGGLLRAGAQL